MASTYTGGDKMSRGSYATGSGVERAKGNASEAAGRIAGAVEEGAGAVKERGKEAADGALRIADEMRYAVRTSLKEQPMATLAVAAAVGFVLGAIWKT